jgi:hypothetical protein
MFSVFTAGALEFRRRGNLARQAAAPLLLLGGLYIALMIGFATRSVATG